MRIRRLGPEDVEAALGNCRLFWDMESAGGNLAAFLADPDCILLAAEVDGRPVGQIVGHVLKRWDARRPRLLLHSIDVVESHRRRGAARRLIRAFHRIGEAAGCGSSTVFTEESDAPATGLYRAVGGSRADTGGALFEWRWSP